MKIFCTSDIHENKTILNKLVKFINKSDVEMVFICGDIGGKHRVKSLAELTQKQYQDYDIFLNCMKEIRNRNRNFLYILGNDDWFEAYEWDVNYLLNVKQYRNFMPFEWVHITPFNTNREANESKIEYELNKLNIDNKSIIIAHDLPYTCDLDTCLDGRKVGSNRIRNMIEEKQPLAWVGGHIHEGFGVSKIGETYIFNCACDHIRNRLRGFIIDTETMKYVKVDK